jgi:hypothetical protein
MDAKVHPARPVHQDAEGKIGLAHRHLRPQIAGESAGQVADHLGAVGHRRHSFRESSLALGRGFHPSASADAEPACFLGHQERSAKLPPVASADREQVAPVVPVEKVVGQIHQVAELPEAAHLEVAMARQVAVPESELGAKQREQEHLKRPELRAQERAPLLAERAAEQQEPQRAPDWLRQAELLRAPPVVQASRELASERQPEARSRSQEAPREQPVSELPLLVAEAPA